jgi:hypothetical protein
VECPWRIQNRDRILVGSEDYYERADSNSDQDWEPGSPGGHLQDEVLSELLGQFQDGGIITTRPGFDVSVVGCDPYGGIQIDVSNGHRLEIFPAGRRTMEWIFRRPGKSSLVLMDGRIQLSHRRIKGQ